MKPKNGFSLLLAFIFFACFAWIPTIAHAAQHRDQEDAQRTAASMPSSSMNVLPTDEKDAQWTVMGPYRITYTITEMDGARRVGSSHYAIVMDAGRGHGISHLKVGSKVPIAGTQSASQTPIQITYLDIGVGIRAGLLKVANGLDLTTQVNQSSIGSQGTSFTKNPIIRSVTFDSSVLLQENKPITLGTAYMPGTNHVLQIQAEITKVQ